MPEPFELNVAEAAEQVRNGSLSPVTLAQSLLERIDSLERLNAWITIDREDVLGAAQERADQAAQGRILGPMHGVPVGLKDIYYTAGMKTTANSKVYADFVPDFDATSVRKMKESRSHSPWQGDDHRVRHLRPLHRRQPIPSRPHCRRLQQRFLRRRGIPHVRRRLGFADRWLHRGAQPLITAS